MHHLEAVVEELSNTNSKNSPAPTFNKEYAASVLVKHNFGITFDCSPFLGTADEMEEDIKRNKVDAIRQNKMGKIIYKKVIRKKGGVSHEAVDKYKLTPQT